MRRSIPRCGRTAPGWRFAFAAGLAACGGGGDLEVPAATPSAARANAPPIISSLRLEPAAPTPGGTLRVVVEASDPDGDPVKLTYDWTVEGTPVGSGLSKLLLRGASKGDRVQVSVIASDGRADTPPAVASTEVGNRPPRLERLLIAPSREVSSGTDFEARPQASDPDGDEIRFDYVWTVDGSVVDTRGAIFSTVGIERDQVIGVEVRASDGTDRSERLDSGPLRVSNWPPQVTSRPGPSEPDGGFRYQVVAEDPDGDAPLRFVLDQAPEGMQIGATTGEIDWSPRGAQVGVHRVRVIVDDQHGGRVSHAFEVKVGDLADGPPAARSR